jgi:multicomponent Na+:H+ antiporter subunit A
VSAADDGRSARGPVDSGGQPRLPGAEHLDELRRSVVLETAVRLVFHTVLVFSVYLLFAGHNQPGGGFVGGLVAGAAFVLRSSRAGGPRWPPPCRWTRVSPSAAGWCSPA